VTIVWISELAGGAVLPRRGVAERDVAAPGIKHVLDNAQTRMRWQVDADATHEAWPTTADALPNPVREISLECRAVTVYRGYVPIGAERFERDGSA
jgi:hypothetical protein